MIHGRGTRGSGSGHPSKPKLSFRFFHNFLFQVSTTPRFDKQTHCFGSFALPRNWSYSIPRTAIELNYVAHEAWKRFKVDVMSKQFQVHVASYRTPQG